MVFVVVDFGVFEVVVVDVDPLDDGAIVAVEVEPSEFLMTIGTDWAELVPPVPVPVEPVAPAAAVDAEPAGGANGSCALRLEGFVPETLLSVPLRRSSAFFGSVSGEEVGEDLGRRVRRTPTS